MINVILAYFLGFISPLVLSLLIFLGMWAFTHSSTNSHYCDICLMIGNKRPELRRKRIFYEFLAVKRHDFFTARRKMHRIAWQSDFDMLNREQQMFLSGVRGKYGIK